MKSTGSWYHVLTDGGDHYQARIVGKLRLDDLKLTNPVGVGDMVELEIEHEGDKLALIKSVLPRKNYIVRQSPRKKLHLHLLASNIDQAFLIVTIIHPNLKQGFIDRFLLMTEPHDIPVTIIFNKADLYTKKQTAMFTYLESIYLKLEYSVLLTSCITKLGLDEVKQSLQGKTTLISGQSGVGKSSIINAVLPGLGIHTKELSDYSGKGQHATSYAEMHSLSSGGFIIDTPGIKTLSFNNLEPMDVAHNFREFFERSNHCKFYNCTHREEPKCAVKSAIEKGEISELRYLNYLKILEEIEEQNYWLRHTEM